MAVARDRGKHIMRALNSLRLVRLLKALQWFLVWANVGDETSISCTPFCWGGGRGSVS